MWNNIKHQLGVAAILLAPGIIEFIYKFDKVKISLAMIGIHID